MLLAIQIALTVLALPILEEEGGAVRGDSEATLPSGERHESVAILILRFRLAEKA